MTEFGFPRRHLRVTDSTNERARELAGGGAPAGTVVTAGAQSAGRGRHGRHWLAPPEKALLYSAILRPLDERHGLLPLAVAVAACKAIEALAPVTCTIKWPNDIWIAERKVGGILIEARPPDWAVIGVGINLSITQDEFAPDLRWPADSVGHGVEIERMREALDRQLGVWAEAEAVQVLAAYRERDALCGREIEWEDRGELRKGTSSGVDDRGNLVVVVDHGGSLAIGAGEVSLRPV